MSDKAENDTEGDDEINDSVGFGRPPRHSQFKRGQSGNPEGRRKQPRNIAKDIEDELGEFITIRENGKERRISKQRAFVKSLIAAAIRGDVRAINAVVNYSKTLTSSAPEESAEETVEDLHILKAYLEREEKRRNSESHKSQATSRNDTKSRARPARKRTGASNE